MIEVKKWYEKAKKDLSAAEINLDQGLFEVSAFLSHQAAEKALKALYILKFKRLWKIHDLKKLSESVHAPTKIMGLCERLNPHYLATRYPLEVDYTQKDANESLKISILRNCLGNSSYIHSLRS